MKGEAKHICEDYNENEESDDETDGEDNVVGKFVQTKYYAHKRL